MKTTRFLLWIALPMLLTGCGVSVGISPAAPADADVETPTLAVAETPTKAPGDTPAAIETPTPSEAPAISETPTATPFAPLPPGLVYATWPNGLLRVGSDGQPQELMSSTPPGADSPLMGEIALSPDQQQIVYTLGYADIWLTDLRTGESRNLTNTPDVPEQALRWWPARPGVIVFHVIPDQDDPFSGHPAVIDTDGDGYQVLASVRSETLSPIALSPDGETMAVDSLDGILLTHLDGTGTAIPADAFGEPYHLIGYPQWSPDGGLLAVGLHFGAEGDGTFGVGIYDPTQQSGTLINRHPVLGGRMFSGCLAWSPDGEWLVHISHPQTWVVRVDGSEAYELGESGSAFWSPDGTQLMLGTGETYVLFDMGNWQQPTPVLLPADAAVVAWVVAQP